ncbi:MAG: hypothetical protein PHO90_00340, partial [Candidatus Pacebacteria bacterium]|nr:hypothetical protein [Candidatus Paceibacterota bacterium]
MQNFFNRIIKFSIYALVFLVPLFFLPFSFEIFEYNKQYLLFFLVSLAFFAWIAKMVIYDKEIRFKRSPLDVFVLAFLGVAVLSAIFSADKSASLFGFYGRFSNGLIGLLSCGALYFLITNNVGTKSQNPDITIGGLLKTFSWSAFSVVFLSFFAFFGLWAKLANFLFLPRAMSSRIFNPTSASPEGLAIFLAVVAVFLVGRMLTSEKSTRLSSIANALFLATILFLLILIDFTAAWLILLVTFALFVGLSLWKRVFRDNVNRLLVPIFLVIVAAVCIPLQSRTLIFGEGSTIASLPREQVLDQKMSWQIGFGAAVDNVKNGFLGSGIGTFSYDFAKEKPLSINQSWLWQIRFDRPGSYVAEVLGTMGFLGIFSLLALMAMFLMISYFFLQQKSQALLLLMAFVALLVSQFVYYQNTTLSFLFWLILGLSVISWQKPIKEKSVSFKNFPELSLVFSTIVIILGVAFLAMYFYGIKFYLADVNYAKSQTTVQGATILEKAVRQNPNLPQYRAVLARTYMNEALNEMAKPSGEQDSNKIQVLVATAINQARVASDLAPNQVAIWETLGMVYREIRSVATGATDWGIKSFERAIALEPTNPVTNTELGNLYLA